MLISNDLEKWFDDCDTSSTGTLTKDEIIKRLCATFDVKDDVDKVVRIKQSILGTWCIFQANDNDVISKNDFLKSGGIGDCLVALEKQIMPDSDDKEDDGQQTQMVRVPIPEGMKEGKKLKIRSPGSNETAVVYVPNNKEWKGGDDGKSYYFDVEIPLIAIPQTIILPEWISFDSYEGEVYEAPKIGMKSVVYDVPAPDVKPNGRRKALLIGINYTGTNGELKGCCADVKKMKELLLKEGFTDDPSCMVTLMEGDDIIEGSASPTKKNIQKGFDWLTHNTTPGDVLFFHFSGHGAQIKDTTGGYEADGLNETILPIDYLTAGEIVDDELWGRMVYKLPNGVRLTAVMDCCHSGTGLDLPFTFDVPTYQWIEDENPAHSQGHVVLFSGCEDGDNCREIIDKCSSGGAMTNAFIAAYDGGLSFTKFIDALQFDLQGRGFTHQPQLSSTQKLNYRTVFNITDGLIVGNSNGDIGRGEVVAHTRPVRTGCNAMNDILYYQKLVEEKAEDPQVDEEESEGDDI